MSRWPVLAVRNLTTSVSCRRQVADGRDKTSRSTLGARETLAIVGESGSGKSVTALSIMRLLPPANSRIDGRGPLEGRDLLALPEEEMRARPRQRDRDDLPGADDQPQSGADRSASRSPRRLRYHRGLDPAPRPTPKTLAPARPGAHSFRARSACANIRTSFPAACGSG